MKIKVFQIRLTDEHRKPDQIKVNQFLSKVEVRKTEITLISGNENFWSVLFYYAPAIKGQQNEIANREAKIKVQRINRKAEQARIRAEKKAAEQAIIEANRKKREEENAIRRELRTWRKKKAEEEEIQPYLLLWEPHLVALSQVKPTTKEELLKLDGFNKFRVEKYGDEILEILGAF